MPITLAPRADHLHVHWSGRITPPDLARLFHELPALAANCGFRPHVLHTSDPAAELQLDTIEAWNYSMQRTRTPIPVQVRAAFVAHTPAGVALARTFENLNRNPHLTMRSFPDESRALAWLRGSAANDPQVLAAEAQE